MIRSMTAYARQQQQNSSGTWWWELRSVNHRYLDSGFRLPDSFKSLEPELRTRIAKNMKRGKVDCQLRWQSQAAKASSIEPAQVSQLQAMLHELQQQLPTLAQPTLLDVLHWPGIVKETEFDIELLSGELLKSFEQALEQLNESRAREGHALNQLIEQRLVAIEEQVNLVRAAQPQLQQQLHKKIQSKMQPILESLDADSGRLEQELSLQLQRLDVEEELDRLDAHVIEVRRILAKGGSCGRRLDFMMQELNREANTLSSKAAASDVVQSGVELKVLIEQMREQIQNIE